MGKRGPKKTPNEVHRARGNPGMHSLPDLAEIEQLPALADVPDPLRPLASSGRSAWDIAWEKARGWLAESDKMAVQIYCEAVDDYVIVRTAYHQARANGDAETNVWRLRKHAGDAAERVFRLASELGLSPVSRSEIGVAEVRVAEGIANITGVSPDDRSFARIIDV